MMLVLDGIPRIVPTPKSKDQLVSMQVADGQHGDVLNSWYLASKHMHHLYLFIGPHLQSNCILFIQSCMCMHLSYSKVYNISCVRMV